MNLVSFVVCRFAFSLILITHGLFVYRYRMSTFYFSILVPTVVIMWIINIVLFWRLFTNDVLRQQRLVLQRTHNDNMLKDVGTEPVTAVVNNNHASASRNKTD